MHDVSHLVLLDLNRANTLSFSDNMTATWETLGTEVEVVTSHPRFQWKQPRDIAFYWQVSLSPEPIGAIAAGRTLKVKVVGNAALRMGGRLRRYTHRFTQILGKLTKLGD
jgi:hypothetical protein